MQVSVLVCVRVLGVGSAAGNSRPPRAASSLTGDHVPRLRLPHLDGWDAPGRGRPIVTGDRGDTQWASSLLPSIRPPQPVAWNQAWCEIKSNGGAGAPKIEKGTKAHQMRRISLGQDAMTVLDEHRDRALHWAELLGVASVGRVVPPLP